MNTFPLKEDMVIWFASAWTSRKISELNNNPRISIRYTDHIHALGYAVFKGT